MLFLSEAMFSLNGLPSWLTVLTRINPLAVAALRSVVFHAQHMPAVPMQHFRSTVELFGHALSNWTDLGIVTAFAGPFYALAVRALSRTT